MNKQSGHSPKNTTTAKKTVALRRAIFLKASYLPKSKHKLNWDEGTTPDRKK